MIESQTKMIYDHFIKGRKLTSFQALKLFGSIRLPARVYEIEKDYDVTVDREWIRIDARGEMEKRVMQYYIKK